MSHFDFDSFFDGEWDDKGDLVWSESDWKRYLKGAKSDIKKFITYYNSFNKSLDRLNEAAKLMGWEPDDWCTNYGYFPEPDDSTFTDFEDIFNSDHSTPDDMDPYTIHRHPVFITTNALCLLQKKDWESYISKKSEAPFSHKTTWAFTNALRESELQAVMAIQAIDLGDSPLGICHFKEALASLNKSLRLTSEISEVDPEFSLCYENDFLTRFFDIREIWLRVMQDCRSTNL